MSVEVKASNQRVDLVVTAPFDGEYILATTEGQITVNGKFKRVEASTDTGTIYAETEASNVAYKFLWTASYPRIVSDVEIEEIREKAAGKHVIEGSIDEAKVTGTDDVVSSGIKRELFFRTRRGIILFNVPPSQVPNNLLAKKMTKAATAIINGGDSRLAEAVRRAAPKLFSEYVSTVSSNRLTPVLTNSEKRSYVTSEFKRITVQVTDINNRAFAGLQKDDFLITERGEPRGIIDIKQSTTPFNLLLLVDVSGSVENHVDFIRKAARAFVNTVEPNDKVAIVVFNDDAKKLSGFTTDKTVLSESLDTFDAGGGTALYDAIGFGLVDLLEPLKGDRTAVVILSDGDDNRSFLTFESLIGSIEESGALIYPMYVPSGLIAASGDFSASAGIDPLRERYLTNNLSSKAQEEGERLAGISGGVYYPISRLSELQNAYRDIVVQLRTSYTITFKSGIVEDIGNRASPRLRVSVKKDGAFVKLGPVTQASGN
jgi:VWFA-related protein